MAFPDLLMIIPGSPALSVMAWFLIASILLYLAREPAHRAILSLTRVIFSSMRLAAASLVLLEKKLSSRNREVLLAQGREQSERMVEREFDRVEMAIKKDLSEYPALQRRLSETATMISEDYQKSAEVPPAPPGWAKAIEPIAKMEATGDSMVATILKSIKEALDKSQRKALEEYRKSSRERHQWLKKMVPSWRQIDKLLRQMESRINSLIERSKSIDRHMEDYEQVIKQSDQAVQRLSSSSMTQFFISGFVLAIAIGGAFINFNLIARPMQEMVGGNVYLMGFRVADIAALVIILVEISMGLFLMESLRITRLFPVIGALDDKIRVRMIWVSFGFLLLLAGIEAGLAYMRELLSQDDAALVAGLLNNAAMTTTTETSGRWITTAAQMGMGFILPFALTFVAIPMESFVHSSRTVMGVMAAGLLKALAFVLRLIANLARYSGHSMVNIYDVMIFAPLWFEKIWLLKKSETVSEAKVLVKPARKSVSEGASA